ncbi:MAG: hypothetical protein HOB98_20450 [Gammaproteobacteria bacterium]|jgi:pyruvate/2-oxoglutarate dehydrogenase complex dihydrolipoamide dehydrogenase (E3) component|nr:hypothetical protein [Gammaproteobacteria bacterium]MBT4618812.1 hypothetical protein [Gammaproteobacteria bacterium]MBT5790064.1 hypothetical protein [Gammaproteobacteria bacterium]MBT7797322.1 hypothetical protein [Gammaproteobacteria bacterium]
MTIVNISSGIDVLYDLIIIGLGPVGSAATILMAEAGLKVAGLGLAESRV